MWCAPSWVMIGVQEYPGSVGSTIRMEMPLVGVVAAGGEDLLPVHHVGIPARRPIPGHAHRPGAQRREVGAGLRLGVPDGEVHLAGQDLRQEELLLRGGAILLQRWPHGLQGDPGQRHVGPGRFAGEDLLLDLAEAAAAVFGRPAHAQPAVAAHPAHHLAVHRAVPFGQHRVPLAGRDQPGEVGPQLVAQSLLLRGEVQEHGLTPRPCRRGGRAGSRRRRPG